MEGDLETHNRASREPVRRAIRALALDGEEHTGVGRRHVDPAVLLDKLGLELQQPAVCPGIVRAKGVCTGERDGRAVSPLVHIFDIARKVQLGRGAFHGA